MLKGFGLWAQSSDGPRNEPMAYGNHLPAQSVTALQLGIRQPKILEVGKVRNVNKVGDTPHR